MRWMWLVIRLPVEKGALPTTNTMLLKNKITFPTGEISPLFIVIRCAPLYFRCWAMRLPFLVARLSSTGFIINNKFSDGMRISASINVWSTRPPSFHPRSHHMRVGLAEVFFPLRSGVIPFELFITSRCVSSLSFTKGGAVQKRAANYKGIACPPPSSRGFAAAVK